MEIMIIGGRGHGKIEVIQALLREIGINITHAVHNLQSAFEQVSMVTVETTDFVNELKMLSEEFEQQSIVYDKPQSKFISRPLHNFKKR